MPNRARRPIPAGRKQAAGSDCGPKGREGSKHERLPRWSNCSGQVAKWQAAVCVADSFRTGGTVPQIAAADGHRALNRQPCSVPL